ncbi:MAG: NERD domain-containing protein [Anaerolineae bacterium]|jgi:hypothetical protein|nr:NERD domain-containing protein [Anaerolineae bacterium]MDH7473071.1 nuclease-related domain-containing protein [Anaerolineae bacterium]
MKIFRNERHIKFYARIGQWSSLAGMAVLGAGLVVSFTRPQFIWVSFACLLVGFLLSQVGLHFMKRWVKKPRPYEVLEKALKGLDDRFELYSFYLPAPHVLLCPSGLFVLRVQPQEGPITCQGDQWHEKFNIARFLGFSAQESIGDPTRAAQAETQKMAAFLAKHLPEESIGIQPLIVFTSDKAELSISGASVPALSYKKLKSHLRGLDKAGLSTQQRKRLAELFAGHVSQA